MHQSKNNVLTSERDSAWTARERDSRALGLREIFPSAGTLVFLGVMSVAIGLMYEWFMEDEMLKGLVLGGAIFGGILSFVFVYSVAVWLGKPPRT